MRNRQLSNSAELQAQALERDAEAGVGRPAPFVLDRGGDCRVRNAGVDAGHRLRTIGIDREVDAVLHEEVAALRQRQKARHAHPGVDDHAEGCRRSAQVQFTFVILDRGQRVAAAEERVVRAEDRRASAHTEIYPPVSSKVGVCEAAAWDVTAGAARHVIRGAGGQAWTHAAHAGGRAARRRACTLSDKVRPVRRVADIAFASGRAAETHAGVGAGDVKEALSIGRG